MEKTVLVLVTGARNEFHPWCW